MDARLDAMTRAKVDDLAQHFHQPRAAVLCHIMHWGLSRQQTGPLDQGDAQGPVRHLYFYVPSDLRERVENTAAAAGMKVASWLRYMVCRITIADFPSSWEEERLEKRSHDSRTYGTRFMLRLDERSQTKLQQLCKHFDVSNAEIIRQLIAQAEPEGFPPSWHTKAAEHRAHQSGRDDKQRGHLA
jgi:predicted transcriptional regulator